MEVDDPIISVIPIQLSTVLDPNLHLYQYPLLSRPLTEPPAAKNAGKSITARCKPQADRVEVHVPFDTREAVWNHRRGLEYGDARYEEDGRKHSSREERRLEDLRLRSERVPHRAVHMVGVLRGDRLHLHPIAATYKLRPHLGYIDILSQKTRRKSVDDADSEAEVNDDEEDAKSKAKKDRKDAKEVHVSARKTDGFSSSMSDMRREMLKSMAAEESEEWVQIKYCDENASTKVLERLVAPSGTPLECTSTLVSMLEHP